MINNRQQYDFVTIPATMHIDGGILPARDVAQSGVKVLRGEDPAFLLEALAERQFVTNPGSRPAYLMDHVIRADRLSNIAQGIRALPMWGFCKQPSSSLAPAWDTRVGVGVTTPFRTAYNLEFAAADFSSAAADFQSGGRLLLDPIRRLYHDMQKLRNFVPEAQAINVNISTTAYTTTGTGSWQSQNIRVIPSSRDVWIYECSDYSSYPSLAPYSYSRTRMVSAGSYTASLPVAVRPYVSGCIAFGCFQISGLLPDTHECIIPMSATYYDGEISVGPSSIQAAVAAINNHYGQLSGSGDVIISMLDLNGVFTLGDHSDIAGINWNWNP